MNEIKEWWLDVAHGEDNFPGTFKEMWAMIKRLFLQLLDDGYSIRQSSRNRMTITKYSDRDLTPADFDGVQPQNEYVYARWINAILVGRHPTDFPSNQKQIKDVLNKPREDRLTLGDGDDHKIQPFPPIPIFFTIRRPAAIDLHRPIADIACRDGSPYQSGFQRESPYYHMANPMLTSEQRCFKKVGGDNRGVSKFLFISSIRGQLKFLISLLDYKDQVFDSDGVNINSRDLVTADNIFQAGVLRADNEGNELARKGTAKLPHIQCDFCQVTADHQCASCPALFCGLWHRTNEVRLCPSCSEEQPDKELPTPIFNQDDSTTVPIPAQNDPLTIQTLHTLPSDLSINPSDYRPTQVTENVPGNCIGIIFRNAPGR